MGGGGARRDGGLDFNGDYAPVRRFENEVVFRATVAPLCARR